MKIMYNVKPTRNQYEQDKFFTYGKTYDVIADYRKRQSGQKIADNGFVVIDNTGQHNMLFTNQVTIINEDKENTYIFE